MIEFIVKNIGILAMWFVSCVLGWKILDRPSGWAVVAVVFIILVCGGTTSPLFNKQDKDKKVGK